MLNQHKEEWSGTSWPTALKQLLEARRTALSIEGDDDIAEQLKMLIQSILGDIERDLADDETPKTKNNNWL